MRLIDADALIEKSLKDANCYMDNNDIKHGYHNVQCLIYDAPTIDAVPVVRCKDCKWRYQSQHGDAFCINPHGMGDKEYWVVDDWYCSHGERRDDSK